MIALQLSQIAAVTEGVIHSVGGVHDPGGLVVDGPVVTDSRQAGPGGMYVARRGEHADGHDFVADAAARGAVAALTSRPVPELPAVVVEDVERAFGQVARAVIAAARDLTVVAITGSSGKTSTKDLLGQVLAELGPTVAAEESYNSEVGVPLTVVRVDEQTRYLVVEMGARGPGHLSYLAAVAPPDIAVVLNVGAAHLGEFGSRDAVAAAKSELVQALSPSGLAILNADDPAVAAMAQRSPAPVLLVGRDPAAAVRAEAVHLDSLARASFDLVSELAGRAGRASVRLRVHGEHHVANALAVAAVALTLGLPVEATAAALSNATAASRWRMEVIERADGVTIVNDAYNANPESMQAALRALATMAGGRRSWAILGEMRELGAASAREHAGVARLAAELGIARLVVVGEGARAAYDAALLSGRWQAPPLLVPDIHAAYDVVQAELAGGDVVLLKASRDSGLRALGDRLGGRG
ncbi:MAG: UDP-N-acetylmuramoyl-tripeptide--D-alanyl-D-alanine ligase [Actinomycetota bacterium]|nr:UDP-N-acetylmuramoyl-tripeptide--D-alanyl-D-alanine ligase [Actinomycetota bacterium]